jgi:hypothetical protein
MGGMFSACCADIYSMWRENRYARTLRELPWEIRAIRFRDDICACVAAILDTEELERV